MKTYIAVLNRKILYLRIRGPAHFQDWFNPGRNKFIPGVVTPLHTKRGFKSWAFLPWKEE